MGYARVKVSRGERTSVGGGCVCVEYICVGSGGGEGRKGKGRMGRGGCGRWVGREGVGVGKQVSYGVCVYVEGVGRSVCVQREGLYTYYMEIMV